MASTRPNLLPNFILTPQQQNLLFRALTSNQQPNNDSNNSLSLSPDALNNSPTQNQTAAGLDAPNATQESPFLDYDYDLGPDNSFDFDFSNDGQARMIGDLPGISPTQEESKDGSKASSPENENTDKRSHPDDEDDEDEVEGGGKRRESEGKVPKKPGRKPLTNEPSSKRKAQNRAAQRAFRERKEKHLKDLETKVEELEKASAATNNENSQLRAQVEKMTVQLEQYKKKLSVMNNGSRSYSGSSSTGRSSQTFGSAAIQNINDVNFQFEFPKFGMLPGPPANATNGAQKPSSYPSPSSGSSPNGQPSPSNSNDGATPQTTKSRESSDAQSLENLSKFTGVFNSPPYDTNYGINGSRTSLDSANIGSAHGFNQGSPSSSSNSNGGPSSSCGTSPEPITQSPMGFKPLETLTTIGEEQPALTTNAMSSFGNLGHMDFTNFDWISQQNGGQFDPQLFGGYREPQDNILANATFDDSFFNDAFDVDFTTPYNMATTTTQPPKKDICAEIDARKEAEDTIVPAPNGKLLTCNNIWEKLQGCPRVQSGDLDLDGLCSDLQKKAKCGGSGAVVDEQDFKAVMTKYLGGDGGKCPNSA
ncbi:PAP1-domain-containing protein [Xylariaceae sp. FL0016]|nr:PAP1-domain-containing protein [Xylariaceae sp. FL0016]